MATIVKVRVGQQSSWQPTMKAARRWASDRLPVLGAVELEFEEFDKPSTAAELCLFLESPYNFKIFHNGEPSA